MRDILLNCKHTVIKKVVCQFQNILIPCNVGAASLQYIATENTETQLTKAE
jgi:hypothetical protein